MKKTISVFAVALIAAVMLLIGAQGLLGGSSDTPRKAKEKGVTAQKILKATSQVIRRNENLSEQRCITESLRGIKEVGERLETPLDQKEVTKFQPPKQVTERLHPALTDAGDGYLVKFWENIIYQDPQHISLQMRGSTNGGASWYTPTVWGLYYPPGFYGFFPQPDSSSLPKYPSLGYWGGNATFDHIFYGTCVCPAGYHSGGEPQLFKIYDIMDDTLWEKWRWAFDESAGTQDMKHAEIAVDSSQYYEDRAGEDRPWGMQGIIMSQPTDPENPHVDAPYTFWQFSQSGYAKISYYYGLQHCQSIDAAIDPVTATAYTCFDWPDPDAGGKYELLVRSDPFDLMTKASQCSLDLTWDPYLTGWHMTNPHLHLEHPVMAVHGGNMVIATELVADTLPFDDVDILSFHCYDGDISSVTYTGIIAGATYNERYPEIAWVEGNYFICTFWRDNKLFARKSCGGGIWSDTAIQVSLPGDDVPLDYHVADIADNGRRLTYSYTTPKQAETQLRIVDLGLDIFPSSTEPPYTPDWWYPEPEETGVPPGSVVLQWIGGDPDGDCMTYDIHLGTADPPPYVATQEVKETYDPGDLEPNTTYYWQIVATDGQGSGYSDVWTFTTGTGGYAPNTIITCPSDTAFWNDHPYFWETLHIEAVDHGGKSEVAYTTFEYFDGVSWQHIYTDYDGTDNLIDNYEDPIPGADGWSGYWDPVGLDEGYYPVRATMTNYLERSTSDTIVTYYDPFPPVPFIIFPEVFNFPSTSPVDIVFTTPADNIAEMWITVLPAPTSYSLGLDQAKGERLDCFQGYNKGIPGFNQFGLYPNSTTHPGWNFGCAPTAVAACLKYFAGSGYPGLDGNGTMTDSQMVAEIADSMNTDPNSGTSPAELKAGAEAYIEAKLGPCVFKVEHLKGKDVTLKRYLKELFENDEDVICADSTHCVVANSFCVHPQFYVDFMDPGGGNEVQSTDWNKGFDGDKLVHLFIISPKEDTSIEVPDTAGIPEEVEPGTYHFPWEPNFEEYPPGHAYLVDVVIIDVMGHVGWDLVKVELFIRGDANGDAIWDIGDVVFLINYLFRQDVPPFPLEAGNANCDEVVDIGDAVYLINYLFRYGDPPGCE